MHKIITAAAVAATLLGAATTANAQQRYQGYDRRDGAWNDAPVAMPYHGNGWDNGWNDRGYARRAGPPWRGPNQCFVDLGYGRYESCDK